MEGLKKNSELSDQHMLGWLEGRDLVVGHWGSGLPDDFGKPLPEGVDPEAHFTDIQALCRAEHERLLSHTYPLDTQAIAIPDINTLPLALYLGSEPSFSRSNIWYHPCGLSPDADRELRLEPENRWLSFHTELYTRMRELSEDRYPVGMPALVPNLDVLAELRGTQDLLMDMILSPDWVHAKLEELNRVFFEVYEQFKEVLTDPRGWLSQGYFMFRGPGKVALTHCDTAAMIGVDMFSQFVVPYIRQQCDYLDYSLYHVDGPDALRTVDPLLEIESLSAIEFTPGPQVPAGGNQCWYELYRKIKSAGKSVQAVWIEVDEVVPLLDAVGPEGMYLMVELRTLEDAQRLERLVEPYYLS